MKKVQYITIKDDGSTPEGLFDSTFKQVMWNNELHDLEQQEIDILKYFCYNFNTNKAFKDKKRLESKYLKKGEEQLLRFTELRKVALSLFVLGYSVKVELNILEKSSSTKTKLKEFMNLQVSKLTEILSEEEAKIYQEIFVGQDFQFYGQKKRLASCFKKAFIFMKEHNFGFYLIPPIFKEDLSRWYSLGFSDEEGLEVFDQDFMLLFEGLYKHF